MEHFRCHTLMFARVARYIANQEEHHRKRTYGEEYELFVKRYDLGWRSEKTIEMVSTYLTDHQRRRRSQIGALGLL